MISVIVPIRNIPADFARIRRRVLASTELVEIIYVTDRTLRMPIALTSACERQVIARRSGRGHALVQGACLAKGEIILFLHADTLLPENWDFAVTSALSNGRVVGGGFSLKFDDDRMYLRWLVKLSDFLFRISGELWGDRALFVRADKLSDCLLVMDVPIMEDVRLSHCLNQVGHMALLPASVITASDSFRRRGVVVQTVRILLCRSLYTLGAPLSFIWRCYYGTTLAET